MTEDQYKQLEAVLLAAEQWLVQVAWEWANEGRPKERKAARDYLLGEIDEFLGAMELGKGGHGGLGRGGRP